MTDRRSHFANSRVAHESLLGQIEGRVFSSSAVRQVVVPVADLYRAPSGDRDAQLLMGANFEVLEVLDGWCFGRSVADGYVGYLSEGSLGEVQIGTHWVNVRSTHIYEDSDLKSTDMVALSLGSALSVVLEANGFAKLSGGGFVPLQHISSLATRASDPANIALKFLETPYLWGGNNALGIDCSGLVQISLHAVGRSCPRDTDQQEVFFTHNVELVSQLKRGDLVFWRGHVAMMLNEVEMIHANGHHMAVVTEPLDVARKRIGTNEFGEITAMKRP